jgi:hypothetical protein
MPMPGAVGHVLSAKLSTVRALDDGIARHSGPGRTGIVAFRNALQGWLLDGRPADSVLELAMRDLVARFHLPAVEFHPVVSDYEVDFRIIGSPILIECDGWATHGLDHATFERDRARDAAHRGLVRHPAIHLLSNRSAPGRHGVPHPRGSRSLGPAPPRCMTPLHDPGPAGLRPGSYSVWAGSLSAGGTDPAQTVSWDESRPDGGGVDRGDGA